MAISIIRNNLDSTAWVLALKKIDPQLDIRVWPDDNNKAEVEFVLTWDHPPGILREYPNLKCISSTAAGVDHILNDKEVPKNIPITRVIAPNLPQSMYEYVLTAVMYYFRNFDSYQAQKNNQQWLRLPVISMSKLNIGIMGLGSVGKEVAMKLSNTGFNVAGWSRSKKSMNSITSFYGDDQLNQFLKNTNILVCILPLTRRTLGILNNKVFSKLPKNSYVINVARGQHLVEQDILDALNKKQLAGACLDVFTHEPLPKDHLFWQHPNIIITPHVACIPTPELVAHQIIENYNRIQRGEAVLNQIDPRKEY